MHPLHDLPAHVHKALQPLPLTVEEVVRALPNRRYVCKGQFNHQAVYAKIFLGKSAKTYALRDKAGVALLQQAGIFTPQLLHARALDEGMYILIYAAVEHTLNAEAVWRNRGAEDRQLLMQQLVQTVAQHHQAGLLQTDLHLKNFLVQQQADQRELIYTLDGDGIRRLSPWCSQHQKLSNLATLFSKMDVLEDGWIDACYTIYCAALGVQKTADTCNKVVYLTQKIRHRVTTRYAEKKVFRTCTDVKVHRSFQAYIAVAADFHLGQQALGTLDQWLANTQHNIKNGNTCTVALAALAGMPVMIKRYNIKSFWHGLGRAFRPSRAARSWANAYRLNILNIATAQPLALVEERRGALRGRAYFLSEYIAAPDALQYFAQASADEKKQVAQHIAVLVYKLFLLKLSHGDLKASNIKIVNHQPLLIDLDSMQAHGALSQYWYARKHVRDLKRLMKNWLDNPEIATLLKHSLTLQYGKHPVLIRLLRLAGIV